MEKKKYKKKINLIGKIVALLLTLATIVFVTLLSIANILPNKYFMLLSFILLIIDGILLTFLCIYKIKNKIKIVSCVASIILILIMLVISFYGIKTLGFLDNLIASKYKTETYHLIVLSDSEYKKIDDLNNKNIGVSSVVTDPLFKFKEQIDNQIEIKYNIYDSINEMVESLYEGTVEAIILEDAYIRTLGEDLEDFKEKTISIYNYVIKTEIEDDIVDIDVINNVFSVYIGGFDSYGAIESVSRNDVNIIATVNPITYQILLTSIPRDYYVQLHNTTGYKDKLTHCGFYGVDMSVSTIEDLLDIDINYYAKINFSGFINLIDALGGLDVYSSHNFTSNKASGGVYKFTKGYNTVDGKKALSFVRTRKNLGDRVRGENQQAVINAAIKKISSVKTILMNYQSILNSMSGTVATNMPIAKVKLLVKLQLDKMPNWEVITYNLNGSDSEGPTYTFGEKKLWVMEPDQKTIDEAKDKLKQIYTNKLLK